MLQGRLAEGDKVRLLDCDKAIEIANNKLKSLKSDKSKRYISFVIRDILADYRGGHLDDYVGKTFIIRRIYGSSKMIGAQECYVSDIKYHRLYAFCLYKVSEYAVELI